MADACANCGMWWAAGPQTPPPAARHEDGTSLGGTHAYSVRLCRRFPHHVWRRAGEWCGEYRRAGS